jgi:aminoglycoside phosphotransferase (APT) family kinase protein
MGDLVEGLTALLAAAEIRDLTRLSGGASRETWSLDAVDHSSVVRPLVLQRTRGGVERPGGGMAIEGALIRAAETAGVPVASVVGASSEPNALGGPYLLMERVEGETIARKILRDEPFEAARQLLPTQLGRAAARIHSIDPVAVPGLIRTDPLTYYRDVLDSLGLVSPTFELGFRVLASNRPDRVNPTVVHGDFRLGNIIVGPEGLRAVLDWELAHLGDPAEDLGWLCVKAWRFGSRPPVAGLGEYRQLLDAYAEASGSVVDVEVVRWWEAVGVLTWGVMCGLQASSHLSGLSRSHELAAIGRRICENEFDLLELLP